MASTEPPHVAASLRQQAAHELAELRLLRAVAEAAAAMMSPHAIADRLAISEPEVQRLLRRAAINPDRVKPSPHEVILRYAAAEITRPRMLETLGTWPYTYSSVPDPLDIALCRGTWDQVIEAVRNGLLTERDVDEIAERSHR